MKRAYLLLVLTVLAAMAASAETLVIVHKWANSVGWYDGQTGKQLATAGVGKAPHEMALSSDGRLLYVTNYGVNSYTQTEPGGNTISVLDMQKRAVIDTIDLGEYHRPHGIERGKNGLLYITVDQPAALLVVDPRQKRIRQAIAIDQKLPHMVMLAHDDRKAYTANAGSGSVSAVTLGKSPKVLNIEVGGVPMGFALSADEKRLYATTRTGNKVALIDTTSDRVIETIEIPGSPARALLLPDRKHVLLSLFDAGELGVLDTATNRIVRRIPAGKAVEGMQADAAGRFAYASAQGDNQVLKYSLSDWKPVLTIKTDARPDPIIVLK